MNLRSLVLIAALFLANHARGASFYWSKVEVQTASWKGCMNVAYGVAQKQHLTQLKRDNLEVSGYANGVFATITCVGTGGNSKAMAVVMVVGDSGAGAAVRQLRDNLATAVNRERIID